MHWKKIKIIWIINKGKMMVTAIAAMLWILIILALKRIVIKIIKKVAINSNNRNKDLFLHKILQPTINNKNNNNKQFLRRNQLALQKQKQQLQYIHLLKQVLPLRIAHLKMVIREILKEISHNNSLKKMLFLI